MSTYYYMACDDHKVRTKNMIVVSRIAGSHIDNEEQLREFLLNHCGCHLQCFSEHDDERYSYQKESGVKDE